MAPMAQAALKPKLVSGLGGVAMPIAAREPGWINAPLPDSICFETLLFRRIFFYATERGGRKLSAAFWQPSSMIFFSSLRSFLFIAPDIERKLAPFRVHSIVGLISTDSFGSQSFIG
jgi:hypothetical protein